MEDEKMNYHHRKHMGIKMVFGLIVFVVIAGGFFCLGRMSGRAKIGRAFVGGAMVERGIGNREMIDGGFDRQRAGGLIGIITAINGDNFILHIASTNKDYTVSIADSTSITKAGAIAAKSDLAVNQSVSVSGSANSSGQISAVRIIIN
ncbi:MAG: DUF5666 domain-containing protein [Candidatus Berkelbacteria bacterium]|nr:DUF5666 domain-containing protein [Candidatus Berkelbacteria bacterium]